MLIFEDFLTRHLPNTTLIQGGGDEYIIFFHRAIILPQFLARIVNEENSESSTL